MSPPQPLFPRDPAARTARWRAAVDGVAGAVARWAPAGEGPWSGAAPADLSAAVATLDPCPPAGVPLDRALDELGATVLAHAVDPGHPRCAAHLHCPPLPEAAAAELAIGAANQSLDSFDQAPAATLVEDHLVRWLAGELGLPATASGVLTAGGTASNLLGLLLAREAAGARAGHPVAARGLVGAAGVPRTIVCSAAAHFSVRQAAAVLGLGHDAVVPVATDGQGRLDVAALDRVLADLAAAGRPPLALVGTAGTTDTGAVDPLGALAERAAATGAWLHVDAAVGSAFVLSDRLRPRLRGIERADSVTADFHKLWFQPIGASALVVRDAARFATIRLHADYLNRAEDEADGVLNLVSRSLDTSRRFDALKILLSLRTAGRERMAAAVEHLVDLAAAAGRYVDAHPWLALAAPPQTVTCLFRVQPPGCGPDERDELNAVVARRLFDSGRAVVGRTRVDGSPCCKLTFVNPALTAADVIALLDLVVDEAARTSGRSAPAAVPA
jgi:L-2,4-diaminobutyrate decarboxylase